MAKVRGAKKISELDEALDFNNIAVDDGTPIGKRITKDRLKNLIGSEGAQLKAVQGGTSGTPTVLVDPETTEYRWMKASPGEYTFGGTPYSAAIGREWIFEWLSGTWSLKDMGALPVQEGTDSLNPTGENIPKEKAVANYAPSKSAVGILEVKEGENVILEYTNGSLVDTVLFDLEMYYHKQLGNKLSSAQFVASKIKKPIAGGISYNYRFFLVGTAGVVFFDNLGNVVQSISTTNTTVTELTGTIYLPASVVSVGLTFSIYRQLSDCYLIANESKSLTTNNVFATPQLVDLKKNEVKSDVGFVSNSPTDNVFLTYNSFSQFGFKIFDSGQNVFSFLNPVNINDSTIWESGFLRNSGVITPDANWFHTKGFYNLPSGTYTTNLYGAGNAYLWIVNDQGSMIRAIQGGNQSGGASWTFSIDNAIGEYGVKLAIDSRLALTRFVHPGNKIFITPNFSRPIPAVDVLPDIKLFNKQLISKKYPSKLITPIITFISDDFSVQNDWFIDALNVYGYKATFAIITGRFNLEGFYNKSQAIDIVVNQGHEGAGHTVDHDINNQLATLNTEQLHYQIGKCKMDLLSLDNRLQAENFVSPFGSRNVNVDRVVRQYFDANYVTRADSDIATGAAINYPPIDNFYMKRVSFDVNSPTSGAMHISRIDVAKQAVDYIVANGGWLIFAIHPHYEQYTNPANTIDSKQELRDLLTYINSLDIPVMTASQARKHYKNQSIGNYRLDDVYYERGIDGTEVGTYLG